MNALLALRRPAPSLDDLPRRLVLVTAAALAVLTVLLTAKGALLLGRPGATVGYLVGLVLLAATGPIARVRVRRAGRGSA